MYLHDDSEHDEDAFTFTATPIIEQPDFLVQEISEFSGKIVYILDIYDSKSCVERLVYCIFFV